jgi:uncharacterized damage-inducible protein DinB
VSNTVNQAAEYATQLQEVTDALVAEVDSCSDEAWRRRTASERWSVGVVAHHVVGVQQFFAGVLAGVASGDGSAAELTSEFVDENNARHAIEFADVDRIETRDELRKNGAELVRLTTGLSEEQLSRPGMRFDGQELTAAQVLEFGLIAHLREHLESMRAAIAG